MIVRLGLLLAVLAGISLLIGDGTLALPTGEILAEIRLPRTLLAEIGRAHV